MSEVESKLEKGDVPPKQKRLLSRLFTNKVPPLPTETERLPYGYGNANIFEKVFFWWLNPILKTGYIRTLQDVDLFKLSPHLTADGMAAKFNDALRKRRGSGEITRNILLLALADIFFKQYAFACVCLLCSSICLTLNPLLVKHLIIFVEDRTLKPQQKVGKGIGMAVGVALIQAAAALFNNQYMYRATTTGAQARALLTKVVFDKTCILSAKARHDYPIGTVTVIIGSEVSRVDYALGYLPYFLTFIVPLAIAIALLVVNIGVSALVGVAVLVTFLFGLAFAAKKLSSLRRNVAKYTDKRINYIKEVLYNLKIIKLYSWEAAYVETITKVRNLEMNLVLRVQAIRNFMTALAICLNSISYMTTFLVLYAIARGRGNAASIFSSVSLFNTLNQQIVYLPLAMPAATDMLLALGKIADFLNTPEDASDSQGIESIASSEINEKYDQEVQPAEVQPAISAQHAYFEWEIFEEVEKVDAESSENITERTTFQLKDVDFEINSGEFVVILGSIGSGKSSLLQAIAGSMKKLKGNLAVNESSLICASNWVQNSTVKDNITFGSEYDEDLYHEVIKVCCLEDDLTQLTAGDMTEVGERGITLSGGQKARINLARAIYKQTSIILLDDVLSAVDAKVGKKIVENCLLGFLKNKTRVLATHQLSLIGNASKIIFVEKDNTLRVGTFDELSNYPEFVEFMKYDTSKAKTTNEEEENEEVKKVKETKVGTKKERILGSGKLVQDEEHAVNGIEYEVYKNFIKASSGVLTNAGVVPITLFVIVITTFSAIFTTTWLSFWVENHFPSLSQGQYIGIYVMLTFVTVLLYGLEFGIFAYITNTASKVLNIYAVRSITRVPMAFMDITPMGRVMNRFTKDTDVLDNEFGAQMRLVLYSLANVIGNFILCIIYLPWLAISVPFFAIIFCSIASYYLGAAREIKRIEAVKRSFIYNNFNETLQGMDVIKAYKAEPRFIERNSRFVDGMSEAYYITIASQRWLGLHMDLLSAAFVLLIGLLCVTGVFSISPSSSGLIITYVLQISNSISTMLRGYTNVENEMNSVERLSHYAFNLPQEADLETNYDGEADATHWPNRGAIEFDNVSFRYRPELPLVMENFNVKITGGEKIGVCGRTGAGKSSIINALFRVVEVEGGKILIDGFDVSKLGLKKLRSNLAIIPQDPVLFYGSIRKNLDPFGSSSDDKLWEALRRAGLIDISEIEVLKRGDSSEPVSASKFHLDQMVEDNGTNFSLGEKQLIALARALIHDSKILILDEATSSVDYKTDTAIQTTIATEFRSSTVISIAHRLKTILDYDRIIVLDKGKVAEFDTPLALFNRQGGLFRDMCFKSNIQESDIKKRL